MQMCWEVLKDLEPVEQSLQFIASNGVIPCVICLNSLFFCRRLRIVFAAVFETRLLTELFRTEERLLA